MRIKRIAIRIQPVEQGAKEFCEAVKAAQAGESPLKQKNGIYFTSLEALRRVLTPRRAELLHLIRERHPGSVYELAGMARRSLKNVQQDVALLARIGLISLDRVKSGRDRNIPRVEYDRLQLQIPVI